MDNKRYFLGIETSCDETAVGVFDAWEQKIVSNCLFSQVTMHAVYGGVMPELASRSHLEKIGPIFQAALDAAQITSDEIAKIGVTTHPGLHGSLLVGVCFAKAIAFAKRIPIVGVNHNHGHIVSALLTKERSLSSNMSYPYLCLSASGGHSSFFLVKSPCDFELLGETVDDAAGEAYDKVGKLLDLPYPGGPEIEKLAAVVANQDFFKYPRNKNKKSLQLSFSGLKTAVLYSLVKNKAYTQDFKPIESMLTLELQQKVASSFQVAVADIFEQKLTLALTRYPLVESLALVGGVSCNKYIAARLSDLAARHGKEFFFPPREFCTDNGAMIALATYFLHQAGVEHNFSEIDLSKA